MGRHYKLSSVPHRGLLKTWPLGPNRQSCCVIWSSGSHGKSSILRRNTASLVSVFAEIFFGSDLTSIRRARLTTKRPECQLKCHHGRGWHTREVSSSLRSRTSHTETWICSKILNSIKKINQQTLALREKVLGKEHPDTLTSISNVASLLESQGKHDEAMQLFSAKLIVPLGLLLRSIDH